MTTNAGATTDTGTATRLPTTRTPITTAPTRDDATWEAGDRPGRDAVSDGASTVGRWASENMLTVVLAALLLVPSRLVVGPLGAAGRPAELLAMACLLWWFNATVVRGYGRSDRSRVARLVITFFAVSVLISYVMAMTRPIDAIEVRAADRGMLHVFAWAGLWLLTAEGVSDRERLETLLRRLVVLGSIVAAIGVVQFTTGFDVTRYAVIPGLSSTSDAGMLSRNGLNRPQSTTGHPIEFGVIMAMLVPLALHQMFHARPSARSRPDVTSARVRPDVSVFWARIRVAVIALAAVMSVSRSAVLGIVIAACILAPHWPPRRQRQAFVASLVFLVVVKFTVPGLLGTLLGLFTQIGSDDSAASRTNAIGSVSSFIAERPVFGRGLATFLPSYVILDNQLLGSLVEIGVVGLIALLVVLFTGIVAAWRVAALCPDEQGKSLGYSISAAAAIPASSFATFDALGFSDTAMLTFFIGGCACALWRIETRDRQPITRDIVDQPGGST